MRTVNMAHGALFLLAAYIADRPAADDGRQDAATSNPTTSRCVRGSFPCWSERSRSPSSGRRDPAVFLRWNQGQDLRQALITIAIAVILADQMLAQYGGLAEDDGLARRCHPLHQDLRPALRHRAGCSCSASPWSSAIVLWLWLNRTRMGMVIRAGVDDKEMVRALGINVGRRVRHHVLRRRLPRRNGRRRWGRRSPASRTGTDGQWLLQLARSW